MYKLIEGHWYVIFWKPAVKFFITIGKFVGESISSEFYVQGISTYQFENVFGRIEKYQAVQISWYEFIEIEHTDYMLEYLSLFWV